MSVACVISAYACTGVRLKQDVLIAIYIKKVKKWQYNGVSRKTAYKNVLPDWGRVVDQQPRDAAATAQCANPRIHLRKV